MNMNRTNTAGRILALLLTALMVLSLVACGTKGGDKMDGMSSEPKNAEEAAAMHKELMAQENAILSANTELWEKVFMAADKGMTMQEDGMFTEECKCMDGGCMKDGMCMDGCMGSENNMIVKELPG